ncbi:MAG: hypothetical protein Q9M40_00375 [Sulfurimonas sp.]|nr:hypothetical protein [Sulfurimonas sp.]
MIQNATYEDYDAKSFKSIVDGEKETLVYVGDGGSVKSITEGLEIKKVPFKSGLFEEKLNSNFTYSYYLLKGEMELDGEQLVKDDYYVLKDANSVSFEVKDGAELFVIKTPTEVKI